MSTQSQHWYRTVYLKSDHWNDLRVWKLATVKGKCRLCSMVAWNNDVHHISYKRLYDVRLWDLVVLCRPCHMKVHDALDKFGSINDTAQSRHRWRRTRVKLVKMRLVKEQIERNRLTSIAAKQIRSAKRKLYLAGVILPRIRYTQHKNLLKWVRNGRVNADPLEIYNYLNTDTPYPCGEH